MAWIRGDDGVFSTHFETKGRFRLNYSNGATTTRSESTMISNDTRKVVMENCKTDEVEPGRLVTKCEKTVQILKDCIGKPTEVVQSTKEYTEEDVSVQVTGSIKTGDSEIENFAFPGLRSDIQGIERGLFAGISDLFDAADVLFRVLADSPFSGSESPSSSASTRGIPIEDPIQNEPATKPTDSGFTDLDLSGLARDV